jgi:hypothetical protein
MKDASVAHVGAPGLGKTERKDAWWVEPTLVAVGLGIFVVYSTWAALVGNNYQYGPYLSPFYSPLFKGDWWPFSPALLVLWIPLGFRGSCYYYRKAYYRSYFLSPPACSVSEPKRNYQGEKAAPFAWLPVIHRWFMYLSVIILLILWYDAFAALNWDGHFGIGLGTIVLFANVALLSFFTLGCHALRNLVGGGRRCMSCGPGGEARQKAWTIVSFFTERHMLWAWLSLYSVGLADLYVRLCAAGVIADPHVVF